MCDKRYEIAQVYIKYTHALQGKVKIKYKNRDMTYNVNVIIK